MKRTFDLGGTKVEVNSGHGYDRSHRTGSVQGFGTRDEIENTILSDVSKHMSNGTKFPTNGTTMQNVETVNGNKVGYDVRQLSDGRVVVSTYYPK